MNSAKVQCLLQEGVARPTYATEGSSGLDLTANLAETVYLRPLERKLIKTGLSIAIHDPACEAQVRPRSGLALKRGLTVLNSPGTIDADYRGEIGVILVNLSNDVVSVEPQERIAQLVFAPIQKVQLEPSLFLDETTRGVGGFGHTGTN